MEAAVGEVNLRKRYNSLLKVSQGYGWVHPLVQDGKPSLGG
jgi:hypothetical protein